MSGREAMIAEAEKSLGLGEEPNNTNYITRWYGLAGAWCDMSITYWAFHSGNQSVVTWGAKYAYTVYHAQAFKDRGQWHADVAGIQRGDIVFFDWAGSNNISAIDHVGIVTGTTGSNVLTIEGNIGNVCARKVRSAQTIVGYGRPMYALAAPKPKPPAASPYAPFPGVAWFSMGRKSPVVAHMHARLVKVGCNRYETKANRDTIGTGDVGSYEAWMRKCGFSGQDAKWPPGKATWDKLKVPK